MDAAPMLWLGMWKLDGPAVHFQVVAAVEGQTHDMIAHLLSCLMDYFEGLLGSACEPLNGLAFGAGNGPVGGLL